MDDWSKYKDFVKTEDPIIGEDIACIEELSDIISEIIKQRISQYDSKADNFLYRLCRIAPQHPFRNIPLSWLGRDPQNQTGMYVKCPKGMTWYLLLGFQKQDNQLYGVSMIYHSAPPECILIPIESIPESVLSIALKAKSLFQTYLASGIVLSIFIQFFI